MFCKKRIIHTQLTIIMFFLAFVKSFSDTSLYIDKSYNSLLKILAYFIYITLFYSCLNFVKVKSYSLILCIISSILLGISIYYNRNPFLLVTVIAIIACSNNNYHGIVNALFKGQLVSIILIFILSIIGVFPEVDKYRDGIYRLSMGFRHANTAGLYILSICLFGITLYFYTWKKKYYLYLLAATLVIYLTCKSRTSIYCCLMALLLIPVFKIFGKHMVSNRIIKSILIIFVPLCIICTYIAAIYYDKVSIFSILNRYSNDRLFINALYFSKCSLKLFSQKVIIGNWYLDSSYSNLILFNGLIPTVLYSILNCACMNKAIKNHDFGTIICIVIWGIYGFFETGNLFFWFNATLLYLLAKIDAVSFVNAKISGVNAP